MKLFGLPNGYPGGNGVAVSNDGRPIAGNVAPGGPASAQQQCGAMVARRSCLVSALVGSWQ